MKLPFARNKDIVIQDLGTELLVYNLITHKACGLNETSKIIFNNCDGKTSFADLKNQHGYSDEIVYLALDALKKENLLEGEYDSPFAGMSRREVIKKSVLASAVALPVVASLIAPTATHAASSNCSTTPRGADCPVGDPLISSGVPLTCTSFNTNNTCNSIYGSQCSSGKATTDSCTNISPTQINYTCKCAP